MDRLIITTESVKLIAVGRLINFYTPVLGYRPKYREVITIPVSKLSPQSNAVVDTACPICGKVKSMPYFAAVKQGHSVCQPCRQRESAYGHLIGQKVGRLTITGFAGDVDTGDGGKRTLLAATCECGNSVTVWGQNITRDIRTGRTASCGCYTIERTTAMGHANAGENNGMFRHDLTVRDRVSRRQLLKRVKATWAKRVRRRDGACCICGSTDNLTSHHLYSVRHKPDLALDDRNGITVCTAHHESFHCVYMGHVHAYTSPGDFYAYLRQVHEWSDSQVEQLISSKELLR